MPSLSRNRKVYNSCAAVFCSLSWVFSHLLLLCGTSLPGAGIRLLNPEGSDKVGFLVTEAGNAIFCKRDQCEAFPLFLCVSSVSTHSLLSHCTLPTEHKLTGNIIIFQDGEKRALLSTQGRIKGHEVSLLDLSEPFLILPTFQKERQGFAS